MKKEVYQIENQENLIFTVQSTQPFIDNGKHKEQLPQEITLVVEDVTRDVLQPDGTLVLSLSKESAEDLITALGKLL